MDQPDHPQPVPLRQGRHAARRPRALMVAMVLAFVLLVAGAVVTAYLVGASRPRTAAPASSPATAGTFSAGGPTAATSPTTTTRPPVRRLGILITMNIGTGEATGQANRVFLLGRDTKPGPKLRVVPASVQPVDIDPDPKVRRAIQMPLAQILDGAKRGLRFHPSPQLVARPGERVEIVIQNRDTKLHSFTYDPADAYKDVFAGKTRTYEFTVPRRGAPKGYAFYCRWRLPGMDGWLVVQGPPAPKLAPRGP
jgi:hypothetical protein